MLKTLKLSDKQIISMYQSQRRVGKIADDAGCSKTTIYRRMEALNVTRNRKRCDQLPSNMVFRIKPLKEYKNGEFIGA